VSWTPAGQPWPRTGWRAAFYAAVRQPERWFSWRRLVWLGCIAFCLFVLWGAGSHLGPGLSAAHGNGTPGLWMAQQDNAGNWTGQFVSSSGIDVKDGVGYAGSLPNEQAGTVVPALDAGAGNEVYPLTGSDRWVHDLIGVIAGSLALFGLLARGFYVARRRRRAGPADYLDQAVHQPDYLGRAATPKGRGWLARPARQPRTRAGKLGLLAVGLIAIGWGTGSFCALLADVQPYSGWEFPVAVAGGIVIAVGAPWVLVLAARRATRWGGYGLLGYVIVLVVGIRVFVSTRFIAPPPGAVVGPLSGWDVANIVGLSAEALTCGAITLLLLLVTVEVMFPGPVGRWLRSGRWARPQPGQPPARHAQGWANTPDRDA
jgi:hypothetical protein